MKLQSLLKHLMNYEMNTEDNPDIRSIEMDSRQVAEGTLFICIHGYTVDGHEFVNQAVEKGAAAILAEKKVDTHVPVIYVSDTRRAMAILADAFYGQPTKKMHLIGITGTNGKTTTSHLIEKILADDSRKTGLIGTIDMKINGVSYKVANTTPESLFLQRSFSKMIHEEVDAAVMEVSSHALDQGRVRGCDFNVAVFTNLTQDHLDYHKDMDAYLYAKSLLFAQLGNTYDNQNKKAAVLNSDDKASQTFLRSTSAHVVTYGIEEKSDFMAENIKITASGTSFMLISPVGKKKVSLQMVGKFSVYNALAALAATYVTGVDLDRSIQTLEGISGVPGRFETVQAGQDFSVIVDYSHTPDSLKNVLQTVKEFAEGKVTVLVGCGGDRDKTKRPIMAKIAVDLADEAIFTSDNPRSEDPLAILKDMEKGVEKGTYTSIPDRKEAIFHAVKHANANDVIVIAGKGHETYQQIGNQIHDFDDRLIAREAIGAINE